MSPHRGLSTREKKIAGFQIALRKNWALQVADNVYVESYTYKFLHLRWEWRYQLLYVI